MLGKLLQKENNQNKDYSIKTKHQTNIHQNISTENKKIKTRA